MAFAIDVYCLADRALMKRPACDDPTVLQAWAEERRRRSYFSGSLGPAAHVHQYWASPARRLGLAQLTSVYNDGLEVAGDDLALLAREALALMRHWPEEVSPDESTEVLMGGAALRVPVLAQLHCHYGQLMDAVRLAVRLDGFIRIN